MTRPILTLAQSSGLCRFCGATDRQTRLARESKAGCGQWLFQCGHCQGLYLDPDLTAAGFDQFYSQDYRRLYPFENCATPDEAFLLAIRCREFGFRRARALAALIPQGGRVLEIGSGHGGFLGALHQLRPDLALNAVEPDELHREAALDAAPVTFLDASQLSLAEPFDLIALFHTLEHVQNPVGDLRRLGAVLSPTGRLVAEVPLTRPHCIDPAEIHTAHVAYFTAASLYGVSVAAGLCPVTPKASQACLPDCLWLEAGKSGMALPPPGRDEQAVPPRPRPRWRQWAKCLLPPRLAGYVSRWRHGPALDDSLAEAQGRRFRWGIGIDPIDVETLLGRAARAMSKRQTFRIADINVAKLIALRQDPVFRRAVLSADAAVIDGKGVLWGARMLGIAVPHRIAGIDLVDRIAALCAQENFRPFIVGAKKDVVERAARALCQNHPGLTLAGWRDGYFPPHQDGEVLAEVAAAGADCLIVALPYPRQDLFLAHAQADGAAPLLFGVGGSLDVLAGDRKRAPVWMQTYGLEWLYRLSQEPRRLGPRYGATNGRFLVLMLSDLAARALAQR